MNPLLIEEPIPARPTTPEERSARLERALLGALLFTNHVHLAEGVTPAMFTSQKRAAVFAMMKATDGGRFDVISLAFDLDRGTEPPPRAGWMPLLASYLDNMEADMIPEYAERVRWLASERKMQTFIDRKKAEAT